MDCDFCKSTLKSKSALKLHQKSARYCLKTQGKDNIKGGFICDLCGKDFQHKSHLNNHINICEKNSPNVKKLNDENQILTNTNLLLKKENEILKDELEKFRIDYKELSLSAVKRPTTNPDQ